jgi:hypothetical protein
MRYRPNISFVCLGMPYTSTMNYSLTKDKVLLALDYVRSRSLYYEQCWFYVTACSASYNPIQSYQIVYI